MTLYRKVSNFSYKRMSSLKALILLVLFTCLVVYCNSQEVVLTEDEMLKIENIFIPDDVKDPAALGVDLNNPAESTGDYTVDEGHAHHNTSVKVKALLDSLVTKLHTQHLSNVEDVKRTNETAVQARRNEKIADLAKTEAINDFREKELNKAIMKKRMDDAIQKWNDAVAYRVKVVNIYHKAVQDHNDHAELMKQEKVAISQIHDMMCDMISVQGTTGACVSKQCISPLVSVTNVAGATDCRLACPEGKVYSADWATCQAACPASDKPTNCGYGVKTINYYYEGLECVKYECKQAPTCPVQSVLPVCQFGIVDENYQTVEGASCTRKVCDVVPECPAQADPVCQYGIDTLPYDFKGVRCYKKSCRAPAPCPKVNPPVNCQYGTVKATFKTPEGVQCEYEECQAAPDCPKESAPTCPFGTVSVYYTYNTMTCKKSECKTSAECPVSDVEKNPQSCKYGVAEENYSFMGLTCKKFTCDTQPRCPTQPALSCACGVDLTAYEHHGITCYAQSCKVKQVCLPQTPLQCQFGVKTEDVDLGCGVICKREISCLPQPPCPVVEAAGCGYGTRRVAYTWIYNIQCTKSECNPQPVCPVAAAPVGCQYGTQSTTYTIEYGVPCTKQICSPRPTCPATAQPACSWGYTTVQYQIQYGVVCTRYECAPQPHVCPNVPNPTCQPYYTLVPENYQHSDGRTTLTCSRNVCYRRCVQDNNSLHSFQASNSRVLPYGDTRDKMSWDYQIGPNNDLFLFAKRPDMNPAKTVEVYVATAASNYLSYKHYVTVTPYVVSTIDYMVAENGDIIFVKKDEVDAQNRAQVHIMTASSGYSKWGLHQVTPLVVEPFDVNNWHFVLKKNRDVVGVKRKNTGSAMVEVHVLDATTSYTTFSKHIATLLHKIEDPNQFQFAMATPVDDSLVAFKQYDCGTCRFEVHIVRPNADDAKAYKTFSLESGTILPEIFDGNWRFLYRDNKVFAVNRFNQNSYRAELTILSGIHWA
jgi:hypothetical protein